MVKFQMKSKTENDYAKTELMEEPEHRAPSIDDLQLVFYFKLFFIIYNAVNRS